MQGRPAIETDVILQDVRKFTCQIQKAESEEILGTGVVVSADGIVATCAHVVRSGGIEPRPQATGLSVYFPARSGRRAETRPAVVQSTFSDSDDDLVCLQVGGPLPLPHDHVAVLGSAKPSRRHHFESYGYRRLERYLGGRADGVILGEVDPPMGCVMLLDPIQLKSSQINAGMSGSAVLDVERNLVVGIVSEAWFSDAAGKDRDTAWAVNAQVIVFTDLGIPIRQTALPRSRASQPYRDPRLANETVPVPGHRLDHAPSTLHEWVGRERLLETLRQDWLQGDHLVVGLIGFGGEGKSSLAKRWVDIVLDDQDENDPAGVFWWSFTERANADEFLTGALEFMSAGRIQVGELPGGSARAAFAAGLLGTRRYIFVLDGLEVMQYQQGDQYGSIRSAALREFLEYFATPGHSSFCVVTSRAPLLDLAKYVTYRHIEIQSLRLDAGRRLLRKLGVIGSDAALEQVVRDWDGHALTLSLLGSYLVKRYNGDVRRISAIPAPDPSLPRDEFVRRVLREYNECLLDEEREFLVQFSIFRTPVTEDAMRIVLPDGAGDNGWEFFQRTALDHLVAARILRRDLSGRTSMHPLIRDFYAHQQEQNGQKRRELHSKIADYYLNTARDLPGEPDLDDLGPLIEAAHHACRAQRFTEACDIIYTRLYQGDRGLITRELNAYEAVLSSLVDFFPDQELHRQPLIADPEAKSWILHEVATCLQLLGRMRDAAVLLRRAVQTFKDMEKWHDAAVSCQNLAELHIGLGALPACSEIIDEAFQLADSARDKEDELVAQTLLGTLAHLQGRNQTADDAFNAALEIATEFTPLPVLYSSSGIRYAEHLRRTNRRDLAERANLANLRVCKAAGWRADEASCHIGLGDLDFDRGDADTAYAQYDDAVGISRDITRRDVLIQALLARGRWAVLTGHPEASREDLGSALDMALLGNYRLAEIDIRVALAQLHHASGDASLAWEEAGRAQQMGIEIGYHWGRVDAEKMLARLNGDL